MVHRHKKIQVRVKEKEIMCPHCHAMNLAKAYCCIHCYQVIRPKTKPRLKRLIEKYRVYVVGAAIFILIVSVVMKKWLMNIEKQLEAYQQTNQSTYENIQKDEVLPIVERKPVNFKSTLPQQD